MPTTPTHVRLANPYVHGILADITENRSLWRISGLHVQPMPDAELEPEAHTFVTRKMREGKLEAATQEEWNAQEAAADQLRQNHLQTLGERLGSDHAYIQEADNQAIVRREQRRIVNRRLGEPEEVAEEEDLSVLAELSAAERRALRNLSDEDRATLREMALESA